MYYPSSQIQTNLYTDGNTPVILVYASNNQVYVGFYWTTSKGEYFSGKTPQDATSQPLKIATQDKSTSTTTVFSSRYTQIKPVKTKTIIQNYISQPTQSDYDTGEFVRYFYKKVNESKYMEISKDDYFNLVKRNPQYDSALHIPFYIHWKLTGNKEQVYNTNKNIVQLAIQRQNLYQFDIFLKEDYLKFYK
jgi:hypothetical protein